ncbi:MAG: Gp37-like protein [Blautia sp.]
MNFIGEITDYTALIHVSKWKSYGDFEIHSSVMYDRLFQDGNIIMLDNDAKKTGIIKYIGADDEEGGSVELKGFSLCSICSHKG